MIAHSTAHMIIYVISKLDDYRVGHQQVQNPRASQPNTMPIGLLKLHESLVLSRALSE